MMKNNRDVGAEEAKKEQELHRLKWSLANPDKIAQDGLLKVKNIESVNRSEAGEYRDLKQQLKESKSLSETSTNSILSSFIRNRSRFNAKMTIKDQFERCCSYCFKKSRAQA